MAGVVRSLMVNFPLWLGKKTTVTATLSRICSNSTMWELGQEYLRRAPLENDATLLEELITLGTEPITLDSAKSALIAEKVAEDFDSGKVVIIDGWILSITEARQCALFSIS